MHVKNWFALRSLPILVQVCLSGEGDLCMNNGFYLHEVWDQFL